MKAIVSLLAAASLFAMPQFVSAGDLTWSGCGISKNAFMKELAKAYEKQTGTKIILKGGGATQGIRNAAAQKMDMGGSCRHSLPVNEEKQAKLHHVAWDAIVFIVKDDSPITTVKLADAKKILLGEVTNWKEVGGPDAPIALYIRKGKISGVGLTSREIIFGKTDVDYASSAVVKPASGPLEVAISRDSNGFGMTGYSSATRRKGIKMLKVDGVYPEKKTIAKGEYKLYRPLYLAVHNKDRAQVKQFLDFAMSAAGQKIISQQGTVNIAEGKSLKLK